MTKIQKLLSTLRTGKELTAKEIQTKFGFSNPYRAVQYLREKHVSVYGNQRVLRDGSVVNKYRIGKPTKAMAAMGFTQ